MFLFRSAFWLVIGFLIVAPHGTNFGAEATAAKDHAIAAGTEAVTQIVVSQIQTSGLAALVPSVSVSTPPSVALPMQDSSTAAFVFPRPRPAAMG